MIDKYIIYNNKRLRKGFTTGAAAAAASKAAVKFLLGYDVNSVTIETKEGEIEIPIHESKLTDNKALCSVIKDAGDDADITNGALICSEVTLNKSKIINIAGGKGVGIVTISGLKVEVGNYAINPEPMKMIKTEVKKILPDNFGADIIISVPDGEKLAKKTFNPRLGIIGGISILGTTGIVTPMSEEAYKEALFLQLDILSSKGIDKAIFIFGEYGKDFINLIDLPHSLCVTTSNFIGDMLDYANFKNFKDILIVGHIGKLVKVAGGIFHTHSKMADCRMEILTAYAGILGAVSSILNSLINCTTTSSAIKIIEQNGLEQIYDIVVNKIKFKAEQRVYNSINIEVILFGDNNKILAQSKNCKNLIADIKGV